MKTAARMRADVHEMTLWPMARPAALRPPARLLFPPAVDAPGRLSGALHELLSADAAAGPPIQLSDLRPLQRVVGCAGSATVTCTLSVNLEDVPRFSIHLTFGRGSGLDCRRPFASKLPILPSTGSGCGRCCGRSGGTSAGARAASFICDVTRPQRGGACEENQYSKFEV